MISGVQVSAGLLLLSISAATSLAEERQRGSLDVLLATPLSTRSIVLGKWWGAFRGVPPLTVLPVLIAAALATHTGFAIGPALIGGLVVAYGAAITSLGLALATWLPRMGRAIGLTAGLYVVVLIGADPRRDDPLRPGPQRCRPRLRRGQPVLGRRLLQRRVRRHGRAQQDRPQAAWLVFWIVAYGLVAFSLLLATLMTFNRCLGRFDGPAPGGGPFPRARPQARDLERRTVAWRTVGGRIFIRPAGGLLVGGGSVRRPSGTHPGRIGSRSGRIGGRSRLLQEDRRARIGGADRVPPNCYRSSSPTRSRHGPRPPTPPSRAAGRPAGVGPLKSGLGDEAISDQLASVSSGASSIRPLLLQLRSDRPKHPASNFSVQCGVCMLATSTRKRLPLLMASVASDRAQPIGREGNSVGRTTPGASPLCMPIRTPETRTFAEAICGATRTPRRSAPGGRFGVAQSHLIIRTREKRHAVAGPDGQTRKPDRIPANWSFRFCLNRGSRTSVEMDHGPRFLVGQPKDQIVVVGTVGQWILLVFRKGLHLRRGNDRELAGGVQLALPEQAHRPEERRRAHHVRVVRAGLHGGEKGLIGGGIIAAAVFSHAEGHQVPVQPLPTLTELHPLATDGQCRSELRLVGECPDTARPGHALGRTRIVGVLGEREHLLPGGGEFLLPSEPRLESGNLQGEQRVLRIGRGRLRQMRDRLARAAGRLVCREKLCGDHVVIRLLS